jgi:tRNA modification GTPase
MSERQSYTQDTIAAAATPPGSGGIGVVRISGSDVPQIAKRFLGRMPAPRRATICSFRDSGGRQIDRGIALYFSAPNSFTGEHVLELHGHGGPVTIAQLVEAAIAFGARQAEPGEFTKRAFLNDKLDLLQAEAVADLIGSGSRQAARAAMRSLSGEFSAAVEGLQEQLTRLRLHVEAAIDFPEDDIDFLSDRSLQRNLDSCGAGFAKIISNARIGRVLRDGFQMVIVGAPNVGKSSLLNLLSGQDAAIVTEFAGTTRDILRETIVIDGLTVQLVDTAGLRESADSIEAEGVRRAREAIGTADAVLWIQDANEPPELSTVLRAESLPGDVPVITVRNKVDLSGDPAGRLECAKPVINMSAVTGQGVDALRRAICEVAGYQDLGEGAFTARRRHLDALQRAAAHFAAGVTALTESRAGELLAEELRLTQRALGEVTGTVTSDELLGRIFSEFCIGK